MTSISKHNARGWIEQNEKDFVPPVCNKCMFSDQLKVFFVGGPNQRKDYHIEEGEEVFYQVFGDMCLKVVEKGKVRDVIIKEGEVFLLPARVLHSPQRFENTVGCVVERTRAQFEKDGLRYLVEGTTTPLYERYFHLEDVVKDLPPAINAFMASDACKTGKPTADSVVDSDRPFEPDHNTELIPPFDLYQWAQNNAEKLRSGQPLPLFPEYKNAKTRAYVFGKGTHEIDSTDGETVLFLIDGCGKVAVGNEIVHVCKADMVLVKEGKSFTLTIDDDDGFCMSTQMPTPKEK